MLATWAADCAERVLPLFEKVHHADDRPRKAIEVCRTWTKTGVFSMPVIRGASLAAHSAAREVKQNKAGCFAAHAAGQAVATAHVPQHAYGAAYYALKAVIAAAPDLAEINALQEWEWELKNASPGLRKEVFQRIIIQKNGTRITIKINKEGDF